jgi:hypothetical protein
MNRTSKNLFFITHPIPLSERQALPDFGIQAGGRALYSGKEEDNRCF